MLTLMLFMQEHGGVTAREIGTTLSIPKLETDSALAQLVIQELVTLKGFFCPRYTLSEKGVQLLADAQIRVEAIIEDTTSQGRVAI